MTKRMFTLRRMAITLLVAMMLGFSNFFMTTANAATLTQISVPHNHPNTICFIESEGVFIDLDNAAPDEIGERFVRNSIDNGYIYVFRSSGNRNVELAIEKIDKSFNVKDKTIKDPNDLDPVMLNEAAKYLGSESFSVVRIEIKERSKETTEQKVGKILGYAAAAATIISIFKK